MSPENKTAIDADLEQEIRDKAWGLRRDVGRMLRRWYRHIDDEVMDEATTIGALHAVENTKLVADHFAQHGISLNDSIIVIMRRGAKNLLQRGSVISKRGPSLEIPIGEDGESDRTLGDLVTNKRYTPEHLINHVDAAIIWRVVEKLSDREKVILMGIIDGISIEDAARESGLTFPEVRRERSRIVECIKTMAGLQESE